MFSLIYLALVLAPLAQTAAPAPVAADAAPASPAPTPADVQLVIPAPPTHLQPDIPPPPSVTVSRAADAWMKDAGQFEPDVYASPRAAARALGARWAKQAAAPGATAPAKVVLRDVPAELRSDLAEGIRSHLPAVVVQMSFDPVRDGPEPACSEARLTFAMAPPREPEVRQEDREDHAEDGGEAVVSDFGGGTRGRLVVRSYRTSRRDESREPAVVLPAQSPGTMEIVSVRGVAAETATAAVRFVDKPWVEEFSAFQASRPGRWVVGRSQPTATDATAAADRALRDAAEQLAGIAESQFGPWIHSRRRRVNADEVRDIAYSMLQNDASFVADRLVQKFDRPYGDTWAGAVLVDASQEHVNALANWAAQADHARHVDARKTFAASLGLVLVTFLLYKLVNAYTRGYFTWTLRTAAFAVLAVGMLLLMVMARG